MSCTSIGVLGWQIFLPDDDVLKLGLRTEKKIASTLVLSVDSDQHNLESFEVWMLGVARFVLSSLNVG